jgi:hypothetical protein
MQFQENTLQYFKQHKILNIPPKNNRNILIDKIKPFISPESNILNVSAKTGEFIHQLNEIDTSFNLFALEENTILYNMIKDISNCTTFNNHMLFLSSPHNFKKYDIILGTPPSYYIDKKTKIGGKFKHWFINKTDIYSLYIIRSIDLLTTNGIMAFIIPDTFLNNPYQQLLRNRIHISGNLLHLERLPNRFTKTTYNTILIVFQKNKKSNNPYLYKHYKFPLYTTDLPLYKSIYDKSTNLNNLRANVTIGSFCTTLNRTQDNTCVPIIYNKNINEDNSLQLYKNNKQYLDSNVSFCKINKKPSLLFHRIVGDKNNPYKFKYASCTLEKYICSESLYVITFPELSNEKSVMLIHSIIKSFNNPKTKTWSKYFIKDAHISKFQLKYYLPIFI